jgi:hypothetical protein
MNNRNFLDGTFDTNFIDQVFFREEKERVLPDMDAALMTAAIQLFLDERKRSVARQSSESGGPVSMWKYATRPGVRKIL